MGSGQCHIKPEKKLLILFIMVLSPAELATLELKSDTFNGKEVWHSKILARTTGMADAIFKVKDIYESLY